MTLTFICYVKRAGDDKASTSSLNLPELQAKTEMLKSNVESQLKYFVEEASMRGNGPSDPSLKLQFTTWPRRPLSRTLSVFKNELNEIRFLLGDTAVSTPTYTWEQVGEFKSLVSPADWSAFEKNLKEFQMAESDLLRRKEMYITSI